MRSESHASESVTFQPLAMMRYGGQLEDIEVHSPVQQTSNVDELDQVLDAFEELYEKINRRVARYPEAGFEIMGLGMLASVDKVKPRFTRQLLRAPEPDEAARKGRRPVYTNGEWHEAQLYEVDLLRPGNRIDGLAILEHPATTMVVPPGQRIEVDEWGIFWLR